MSRKNFFLIAVVIGMYFLLTHTCFALQLLTKEAALEKVFGKDAKIVTETKQLTDAQIAKIKERLSTEALACLPPGAKSKGIEVESSKDFYFVEKEGKKTGVAIIEKVPGKWGPVEFIIALDLQGTVTKVEVLSYEEKRGQPIARHSYLSQFEGKSSKSPLKLTRDITGVSGATISSNCSVYAVKKAIIMYEEVYLK